MKKLSAYVLLFALSSLFLTSCHKDKGDPPVLPDPASMIIDFSNFISVTKSSSSEIGTKGAENSNWEFASKAILPWKVLIGVDMAVPIAGYAGSTGRTAEYISKNNWQWSYSFTVQNTSYKARLTSLTGSNEVTWKMYVSKEGTSGFGEFVWLEGKSSLDATSGQWIFYEDNLSQVQVLQTDWAKTGDEVSGVKYTYIKNGDPFRNSYIEYGLTTTSLNAYDNVHYYTGVDFSDVNIEWNTTTKNGRVKSEDYLGDTDWHCWDTNKINVKCQ